MNINNDATDEVQLDFQDSFSSKNKVRNAEQIQSLVDSVKLVREQVQSYSLNLHDMLEPQAQPKTTLQSVINNDNNNNKNKFISLVLDENIGTAPKTKASRYVVFQEIKANAEKGINQAPRYDN